MMEGGVLIGLAVDLVPLSFMIERESIKKKTGETSREVIYGITGTPADQTSPEQILSDNRGHWRVESCHYIIRTPDL